MSKKALLGAVAAGALALTALVGAGPAAAVGFGVYVGPSYSYHPYRHSCWHWSYRLGEWVNFCRTYSYRHYPDHGPYAYGYGPYYDYGPSFGYGPFFGFSFEGGGHFHHHMH